MNYDQKVFVGTPAAQHVSRRVRQIASAYQDDVTDRVRRFLPMVRRMAWHIHGSGRPGMEIGDLMQTGLVALTECAQKHQGPGEDGFAAYAKMRVRGAMIDMIRRTVPMSRGASERRRQIEVNEQNLRVHLGREPLASELAEAMGVSEPELQTLRDANRPLHFDSIDELYSDQDMAFADERTDALQLLVDTEMRDTVAAAISALPERLQLVIQLYFVEELNLAEIAQVLQVSIPRVHQLKAQALSKLKGDLTEIAGMPWLGG